MSWNVISQSSSGTQMPRFTNVKMSGALDLCATSGYTKSLLLIFCFPLILGFQSSDSKYSCRAYGSGKEDNPLCDVPGFENCRMKLLRHVSFVDCPVRLCRPFPLSDCPKNPVYNTFARWFSYQPLRNYVILFELLLKNTVFFEAWNRQLVWKKIIVCCCITYHSVWCIDTRPATRSWLVLHTSQLGVFNNEIMCF